MSDSSSLVSHGNTLPIMNNETTCLINEELQPFAIDNSTFQVKEASKMASDSVQQFLNEEKLSKKVDMKKQLCVFCQHLQNISSLMSCLVCGMAYHSRCVALYIQPSALENTSLSVEKRQRIKQVIDDLAKCTACQNASSNFCRDELFNLNCQCRVCTQPEMVIPYRKKMLFLMLKNRVRLDDCVPRIVDEQSDFEKITSSEIVKEKTTMMKQKLIRRIKETRMPSLKRQSTRMNFTKTSADSK
uniref:AlNc14C29G2751 protein n=1 Tax=Albugo laibachii Nc14 TaxID=890382 RepID=F0W7D6_9STRA|nr:AlNc14C29G2751 [Albugo laibachii Nc14]|eukprot:CCA17035.1 AlNc14C29G2751 [Albugo laibachii Nc14]